MKTIYIKLHECLQREKSRATPTHQKTREQTIKTMREDNIKRLSRESTLSVSGCIGLRYATTFKSSGSNIKTWIKDCSIDC